MTGYTSPDNLPYPNEYPGVPADVPAAVQDLADAVQAGLDTLRDYADARIIDDSNSTSTVLALSAAATKRLFNSGLDTGRNVDGGEQKTFNIAHGLVTQPTNVICNVMYDGGEPNVFCRVNSMTPTYFEVLVTNTKDSGNETFSLSWVAFK